MTQKVLYISYDGILEPLGYSQVWSYLRNLSLKNTIFLISFEKKSDLLDKERFMNMKNDCLEHGIQWLPLTYHKSPTALATTYDVLMGFLHSFFYVLKYKIKIVHARSYVSALMGLLLKKLLGIKFIFDMRGLWADEKIDSKAWNKEGALYKITKRFEKSFLLNADTVVSLTNAAVNEIKKFEYLEENNTRYEVITTCADLELFNIDESNLEGEYLGFTLGYVGSVSLWYKFHETLMSFKLLQEIIGDARLVIVNKGQHEFIQKSLMESDIDSSKVKLFSADHTGVAKAMKSMDAGIFFIEPFYSKIASAPTRLGEFLGSGVPCLGNYGVGDMGEILEMNHVGVAISDFSQTSIKMGLNRLIKLSEEDNIKQRCRDVAEDLFALKKGVDAYQRIYNNFETR